MNAVQTALSSPRFNRLLLAVGVVVLAAGALTLVVTLVGGSDKTSVNPDRGFKAQLPEKTTPLKNSEGTTVKSFDQLDEQVRTAIKTFIATAVAREHVEDSWPVVSPSMRAGYTYAEWKTADALPVVPYPGVDMKHIEYFLDYATTKEILVEVGLAGKPGVSTRPVSFMLGLEPSGTGSDKKWLVNYWMPRWTPPVPAGQ